MVSKKTRRITREIGPAHRKMRLTRRKKLRAHTKRYRARELNGHKVRITKKKLLIFPPAQRAPGGG